MRYKLGSEDYYSYIKDQYTNHNRSTYDLADELKTYPNRIKRDLIKQNVNIKTRSEAQKQSLKEGRREHPTKGKPRTLETKMKISAGVAEAYENMSPEDMQRKIDIAKQRWQAMPLEQKQILQKRAGEGLREAAENGSRIEKTIMEHLVKSGYKVEFHKENLIPDESLHVDMYIPSHNTAIEIDGPTHFLPIWGEEKLQKTIVSDARKTGLLLSKRIKIIRVKILKKNVAESRVSDICGEIVKLMDVKNRKKFIEIEV